ncbi:MAG: folate-binding protein YgfZ [Thiotrichales bacterium]|nr:folate-binding protein YgfZ [Thiotrichales bacterium]
MTTVTAPWNPIWTEFLTEQGAQFTEDNRIITFGHPDIERFLIKNGPVLTNLSHHALLKVSGTEAFSFLQGQLTSDLSTIQGNGAQLSAYCDPKGNVLVVFLIFKRDGDFFLSYDGSLKDVIQKRLTMFVMRADVQITDVSNDMIHIGFAGEFGDLDIQRRLNTKIKAVYEAGSVEEEGMQDVFVVKVPGPYHKYELFGPADQMTQAWLKLRDNSDVTNTQDWNLLNIAAGVPEITAANTGQFIGQFLNLDKLEAINFKKGCFPGQEIIARVHYRGKVTKRMFRVRIEEKVTLASGDDLILQDNKGKKHSLSVINANPDVYSTHTLCLAVGTLKSLDAVEGDLMTESGKLAILEPLPYSITDEV